MSGDGVTIRIKGSLFKTDFLELFSSVLGSLAHIFLAVKSGGLSLSLAPNAVNGLFRALKSFKREETNEARAWILISGGILFAIERTLSELSLKKPATPEIFAQFARDLAERISTKTYTLEPDFFSAPNKLKLLEDVSHELSVTVASLGGDETHKVLLSRIEKHFPSGLHRTWMKVPSRFEPLELALNSPFTDALKAANEREGYLQYIEDEFSQIRLIGQDEDDENAVRLEQVFIPLRAYHERRHTKDTPLDTTEPLLSADELALDTETTTKEVGWLFEELENWISSPKRRDWLRIVSGGPGIGKSSSMRAFAAKLAKQAKVYPIVIPLQKLEKPLSGLRERVGHYLVSHKEIPFTSSPLKSDVKSRTATVLIFDGLDELVKPGKDADEIARDFMADLQRLLEEENGQRGTSPPGYLAIVTGRMAAASSAAKALKCTTEQVLFLIPFAVAESETFNDPRKLLKEDQRLTWWSQWKATSADVPEKVPKEILSPDLFEVTIEPLLLYFIAYVKPWKTLAHDGSFDRNSLYDQLLRSFYRREIDKGDRNFATEFDEFHSYEIVLQAMALAAWYDGSTRTGTIDVVFKLLRFWDEAIEISFRTILSSNKPAVGAALAFYMKPGEKPNSFEFMHKTFAEYLVARRMLETVRLLSDAYYDWHEAQKRRPFDETAYLLEWLRLFGPREIDHDVLSFLRAEFALQYRKNEGLSKATQVALAFFLQACIRTRMPAHLLFTLPDEKYILRPQTFADAADQERSAEIALLACLNGTILPELEKSNFQPVDIRSKDGAPMAHFVGRVRGHRIGPRNFGLRLLAGLDMSEEILHVQDFYALDGRKINFSGAELTYSVLAAANLSGANLRGASLGNVEMEDASLIQTNCEGAVFNHANLDNSSLKDALFREATFSGATLRKANLSGADFTGAEMSDSDLSEAKLKGAKITKKQLMSVKLSSDVRITKLDESVPSERRGTTPSRRR